MDFGLMDKDNRKYQAFFLDEFTNFCDFGEACRRLQGELNKLAWVIKAQTLAGYWLDEDEGFKVEYEKAKRIVRRINYEKAESFLNRCGNGTQLTGKEHGIFDCSIKAAHMVCDAYDPQMWSSKKPVEKPRGKKEPTRIEYAKHPGRPKKGEITESEQEPDGNSDSGED